MAERPSDAAGQITFGQELLRKATHIGALIIPGGYYVLTLSKQEMLIIMVPITVGMIVLDISRLRQWPLWTGFAGKILSPLIRRHETAGDFTGATYILLSVCLTVALYSKPVAIAALAFIIVGDSLAALIGRRYGRHRIGRKTLEGSLACLFGTVLVALVVPGLPIGIRLLGAVIAAIGEALPLGVDDNLSVPILSGLAMTLGLRIMGNL